MDPPTLVFVVQLAWDDASTQRGGGCRLGHGALDSFVLATRAQGAMDPGRGPHRHVPLYSVRLMLDNEDVVRCFRPTDGQRVAASLRAMRV
jgi:hypothetical protein